jgi:hypothetical protein
VRDDGRLLVLGDGRLELRPVSGSDDGSAEVLYESDGYMAGEYVVWGERAFFVEAGGEVSAVDGEGKSPAGFDADVMAAAGD